MLFTLQCLLAYETVHVDTAYIIAYRNKYLSYQEFGEV